jgi:predicted  nucleic acid-binding Zn-ribbon protein
MSDVASSALVRLHRIHRQLGDLRERLSRGPQRLQAGQTNLKRLEQELAGAKENFTKTRVSSDQRQLQLRSREERVKDLQAKLNTAASNREYQALKEQIAADEQANSVLSDEILELLERLDDIEASIARAQEAIAEAKKEQERLRGEVATEQQRLEGEVNRVMKELQEAEAALPTEFRIEYQRLSRSRGEDALAPVEDATCIGCFTTITTQMLNELLTNKPVFCKSCGRMLYLPEERK